MITVSADGLSALIVLIIVISLAIGYAYGKLKP